jgi:antitoxin (DNA-binding transcriptional repressor) of toxin-antitoxin stability system
MKQTTVRELHLRTGAIVEQAARGRVIRILKRGVPVAELRPISSTAPVRGLPDRRALLATFPKVPDSGLWLEENR